MAPQHLVFSFAGQGFPPIEAARDLFRASHVFRKAITRLDDTIDELSQLRAIPDKDYISLSEYLGEDEIRRPYNDSFEESAASNALLAPPSETLLIVGAQYALGRLLESWGVLPQSVMAYSLGELAAGAVARSYPLPALLKLLARRDKLLKDRCLIPRKGAIARVFANGDAVKKVLASEGILGTVDIAGYSNPNTTVLAGDFAAMDTALEQLSSSGIGVNRVKLDIGMHSNHVQKIADIIRSDQTIFPERDSKDCKVAPGIDHWSSLGFQMPTGSPLNANHYATVLRQPLRFMDCVTGILRKHVAERPGQQLVFIDMGMGPAQLYKSIETTLKHTPEWDQGLVKGTATIDPISASVEAKSNLGWAERQLRVNLERAGVTVQSSPAVSDQLVQKQQRRGVHMLTSVQRQHFANSCLKSSSPTFRIQHIVASGIRLAAGSRGRFI